MSPSWAGAAALVAVAWLAAGCSGQRSEEQRAPGGARAVRIEAATGADVKTVTLTPSAAARLGIRTEPVRPAQSSGPSRGQAEVPVSALMYDTEGRAWVYAEVKPRTYVRRRVEVAQVDGRLAVLVSGPDPGTLVVTVGAVELYGAEFGVGGET